MVMLMKNELAETVEHYFLFKHCLWRCFCKRCDRLWAMFLYGGGVILIKIESICCCKILAHFLCVLKIMSVVFNFLSSSLRLDFVLFDGEAVQKICGETFELWLMVYKINFTLILRITFTSRNVKSKNNTCHTRKNHKEPSHMLIYALDLRNNNHATTQMIICFIENHNVLMKL